MPKSGTSTEYLSKIEDHIGAILEARWALIDLEVLVGSSLRQSKLPQREQEEILGMLSKVRRAVDLGHEFAKRERGRH